MKKTYYEAFLLGTKKFCEKSTHFRKWVVRNLKSTKKEKKNLCNGTVPEKFVLHGYAVTQLRGYAYVIVCLDVPHIYKYIVVMSNC